MNEYILPTGKPFIFKELFFRLTNTRPHVHGGHEAIVTQTAVFPRNVGALASVTDIWSFLTLINI